MVILTQQVTKDNNDNLDPKQLLKTLVAVKKGNFSVRMPTNQTGIAGKIADTLNNIIELNERMAAELDRIGTVVGKEGKITQRASLRSASGSWKKSVDSVNTLIADLVQPTAETARVIRAVANGDLSQKIGLEIEGRPLEGEFLQTAQIVNTMVDQLSSFAQEVTRVVCEVGTQGKLGVQAEVQGVAGTWKDLTNNVNLMASNLTGQVRNIAEVATAIASGDLSKKITVDVKGEILDLKNTINTMVDQLNSFAREVTRVAREVGAEGKLGAQAEVRGVAGTWKDLTESVNMMAGNLTGQVRNIAEVATAVASGDLSKKITVDVKGEILELKNTINVMVDQLNSFAWEVTRVAREVGTSGKLGVQAEVKGVAGTWKDLTDNVNLMVDNLTSQVRAIAEVATAVTKGDLTQLIAVEAQGEVAVLKDNINQMIANLRETTQKNIEQDWLKSNLAKFTRMLQGERQLETVSKMILSDLAPLVSAQHGVFYLMESGETDEPSLKLLSTYAYSERKHLANQFGLGEGLVGQCALEKKRILLTEVPDSYIKICSGLGEATPLNVVVLPMLFEGQVTAVIELASFQRFSEIYLTFLDQLTESIAIVLNTITANMRTEELLKQSQSLTLELQSQQNELRETNQRLEQQAQSLRASEELLRNQQEALQHTNEELEEQAKLLALQNQEVACKNREIELARLSLEEKAEQLALSSKYKSEFLANMSHELRTPLNSLLILGKLLFDNAEGNLTSKQIEYSRTIHSVGTDLLGLISDILEIAKIESGTMSVYIDQLLLTELRNYLERTFHEVASDQGLQFVVEFDEKLPMIIYTDPKRLQQILKNLLSNAFKFTEHGEVSLRVLVALSGWSPDQENLNNADTVIAFSVSDTGVGIPTDKQKIIFESFQQADGSTSRKYGGTGLGLSISREIAQLLGGEIQLVSSPGQGSTFTLYLPRGSRESLEESITSSHHLITPSSDSSLSTQQHSALRSKNTRTYYEQEYPGADSSTIILDDSDDIQPGDRVLLIVEDDINFANVLLDMARQQGFKGLVALRSDTGLAMTQQFKPNAIILDIRLPEMDGWVVLDRLKHDSNTRHIPVHIISIEERRQRSLQQGAIAYLQKPVTSEALAKAFTDIQRFIERQQKNLLVVEDDEVQRNTIVDLIGNSDVQTTAVSTGTAALLALKAGHFDCVVLDLDLPDMTGFELIELLKQEVSYRSLPIIIYSGREITRTEETELKRMAETIIIKDVRSLSRLFDETALFLHRVQAKLPAPKRQMLEQLYQTDPVLAGKKVLIVDDDVRNIFALTSMLEHHKIQVLYAENGYDGIIELQKTPDIDIVLMDVMMPEMDGYKAMHAIRQIDQFRSLPIIALTAKAMQGDRENSIEAGASDYIAKPVDTDQLLSLLRVWLYK